MRRALNILIVDDEKNIAHSLAEFLSLHGYNVDFCLSPVQAIKKLTHEYFELIITDYKMPGMNGYELSLELKKIRPEVTIIIMTAFGSIQNAVEFIKHGIYDYITKPIDTDELIKKIQNIETSTSMRLPTAEFHPMLNISSEKGKQLIQFAHTAAKSENTVLLTGETGTGKTELGRLIHDLSSRANQPFVYLNCAAISANLIESELFGHTKGSFTGADTHRAGKLLMANGGTLFLDEIGSTSTAFQSKLLSVLQTKSFEHVGSDIPIQTNVRFIAATNIDIKQAIHDQTFRADLYYRLKILSLHLPPLRERKEDLPFLISFFIKKYSKNNSLNMSELALKKLQTYNWPGNIRELENTIASSIDNHAEGSLLEVNIDSADDLVPSAETTLDDHVSSAERDVLCRILKKHHGSIISSAQELGIHERSLRRKMKLYNLNKKDFFKS